MKTSASVTRKSGAEEFAARLEKLKIAAVYVGIPADRNLRSDSEVTNSQLLYIQSKGSPLQNIPPRPVIEPAIESPDNRSLIADEMKQAAQSALEGDAEGMHQHLENAGQLGENAAKAFFTDPLNQWAPDAPSTIEEKGSSQPLVDTGSMRSSITHVVQE
jgi:hypothetical protein